MQEQARVVVEQLPVNELVYISELGVSPLCSYHYIKHEDKKLIGKIFKFADMERENVLQVLKQQLHCTEIAQHPFLPLFCQNIETEGRVMELTQFI